MDKHDVDFDVDFMSHPILWPRLFLPVKLRNGNPFEEGGMGILLAPLGGPTTPVVYVGNMFNMNTDTCPKREYKNLSELALEWRVD